MLDVLIGATPQGRPRSDIVPAVFQVLCIWPPTQPCHSIIFHLRHHGGRTRCEVHPAIARARPAARLWGAESRRGGALARRGRTPQGLRIPHLGAPARARGPVSPTGPMGAESTLSS